MKISQYTYDCQASFFIDVSLQWKELRKIVKFWWAVEGTTYRGCCKSLLCVEMTLTFQAFLGCAPHHPRLIYAWYDSISMPDTIPLEINVEWWGRIEKYDPQQNNISPKGNTNFRVLTDFSAPYTPGLWSSTGTCTCT